MDLQERELGSVTVLFGSQGGKYPDGNSVLIRGREETALIDPALGAVARRESLPRVDWVLNSHCHEDHIAGNHLFPEVPWLLHEADLPGMLSLDGLMEIYGLPEAMEARWRQRVVERFHYRARPDPTPYGDGSVFDLGGTRVRAIHAPGHTRGHCVLYVEPDGVLVLGDIELSSFGPYYGDAWSSLEDFEKTLERVREIEARHYVTFHHIGVLDGREAFLERLDRFAEVIRSRERRLLAYLEVPHTLQEIAEHRFVYRPKDPVPSAASVEARSMRQHIERLKRDGRVREVESGRYIAVADSS